MFSVCKQNFTAQQLKNKNSYECENFSVCYLCRNDYIKCLLWYNLHGVTFSICLILEEKFADDPSAQFYFLRYYRPEKESKLRKSLV